MFGQADDDSGDLALCAEYDVEFAPNLSVADLRHALEESQGFRSRVSEGVAAVLAEAGGRERLNLDIDPDFGTPVHLVILQDVNRRSTRLQWVSLTTAYPHSGLHWGVGGRATLVRADVIQSQSTDGLIETFLDDAKLAGA
jgi:hypothetical protein